MPFAVYVRVHLPAPGVPQGHSVHWATHPGSACLRKDLASLRVCSEHWETPRTCVQKALLGAGVIQALSWLAE